MKTKSARERGRKDARELTLTELEHLAYSLRGMPFDRAIVERAKGKAGLHPPEKMEIQEPATCGETIYRLLRSGIRDRKTAARINGILSPGLGQSKQALTSPYTTSHFSISYDPGQISNMAVASRQVILYNTATVIGALTRTDVPDYVQAVGVWLEYALARLIAPPFEFKNPAAAGPLEITLTDTGWPVAGYGGWIKADGVGRIWLYYNLNERELSHVPAHELFHVIQDLYQLSRPLNDYGPEEPMWTEGTAELIPDFISDFANVWMMKYDSFLGQTGRSLPTLEYTASGFWRYLCEQAAVPWSAQEGIAAGVEVVRQCWESLPVNRPPDLQDLIRAVEKLPPAGQRFAEFARSAPNGGDLLSNETFFGNWVIANWAKDYGNPMSDRRFDYLEDEEPPSLGSVLPVASRVVDPNTGWSFSHLVSPWSALYWIFDVDRATQAIHVRFTADSGADCLLQLVLISNASQLIDIIKTKDPNYTREFSARGVWYLAAIVSALSTTADCHLEIHPVGWAPDLMITRWNSAPGCEYEQDPRTAPWTYDTPDLWVVTGGRRDKVDLTASGNVCELHVRARNKGGTPASGATVRLYQQRAVGGAISDGAWLPVINRAPGDPAGQAQTVTLNVDQYSSSEGTATWHIDEATAAPLNEKSTYRWLRSRSAMRSRRSLSMPRMEARTTTRR